MRTGGTPPRAGTSGFNGYDRFAATHTLGDSGKSPRVTKGFEIQEDPFNLFVVLPILQQIVARNVCLVTYTDELGETQPAFAG